MQTDLYIQKSNRLKSIRQEIKDLRAQGKKTVMLELQALELDKEIKTLDSLHPIKSTPAGNYNSN